MKRLLQTTIALVALIATGATPGRVGDKAPPFQALDLDGHPVSLAAQKGNIVVVHFAASW
jgi:hypothetical protein